MITFIVFALACGIVAVIIGLCVLYVWYDGGGGHTGDERHFRPATGPPRPLTLPYYEFGSYSKAPELHDDLPGPEGPGLMKSPTAGVADSSDASPGARSHRAGEPDTPDRLMPRSRCARWPITSA